MSVWKNFWGGKEYTKTTKEIKSELYKTWRKQSSGMLHRVDVVLTDVSEERIASIFRVEEKINKISHTTRPWERIQDSHRRENLKSYIYKTFLRALHGSGARIKKGHFFSKTEVAEEDISKQYENVCCYICVQ